MTTANDQTLPAIDRASRTSAIPASARHLERILEGLESGSLVIRRPDGRVQRFQGSKPGIQAHWTISDWRTYDLILQRGDVGLGEAYLEGWWDSSDPAALVTLAASNRRALRQAVYGNIFSLVGHLVRDRLRRNSLAGSRRNIRTHYDSPSTDFFRLWLDPTMTYSAGLFDGDWLRSLKEAQVAKHRDILDRLRPKPGDSLLEVGCGWGGFMLQALQCTEARITGITLSEGQRAYVQAILDRNPVLAQRAEVSLRDYRQIQEAYDHIVSIEMFEHVGRRYWRTYFRKLREHLKPGGKLFVQTTVIAEDLEGAYRRSTDFIRRHVFPGGLLPSVRSFSEAANQEGFQVRVLRSLREDYVETLRRWRQALLTFQDAVFALGYDERTLRKWDMTFSYSMGAFASKSTDVYQFLLQ